MLFCKLKSLLSLQAILCVEFIRVHWSNRQRAQYRCLTTLLYRHLILVLTQLCRQTCSQTPPDLWLSSHVTLSILCIGNARLCYPQQSTLDIETITLAPCINLQLEGYLQWDMTGKLIAAMCAQTKLIWLTSIKHGVVTR